METHSSVLTWRIPGMGEPDGLPSMGSHKVPHDWSDLAAAAAGRWKEERESFLHLLILNCLQLKIILIQGGIFWSSSLYQACFPRVRAPFLSPVAASTLLVCVPVCSVVSDSLWPLGLYVARQAPLSMGFPSKNTGVGCHFVLQGIFLTQGWTPSCQLGRGILYHWATWEAQMLISVMYPVALSHSFRMILLRIFQERALI